MKSPLQERPVCYPAQYPGYSTPCSAHARARLSSAPLGSIESARQ